MATGINIATQLLRNPNPTGFSNKITNNPTVNWINNSFAHIAGGTGPTGPSFYPGTSFGEYIYWNTYNSPPEWSVGGDNITIGSNAGEINQTTYAVALGRQAGRYSQGIASIAIGNLAGNYGQRSSSISIGNTAGASQQGTSSIAIGESAGNNNQGYQSIAIGSGAGQILQTDKAIAIGDGAGYQYQKIGTVALGSSAGRNSQGSYAISIGYEAGKINQGSGAIAIGYNCAATNQCWNSIAIGNNITTANFQGFYANPIRNSNQPFNPLVYDSTNKEIIQTNTVAVENITGSTAYFSSVNFGYTPLDYYREAVISGQWVDDGGSNILISPFDVKIARVGKIVTIFLYSNGTATIASGTPTIKFNPSVFPDWAFTNTRNILCTDWVDINSTVTQVKFYTDPTVINPSLLIIAKPSGSFNPGDKIGLGGQNITYYYDRI